MYAVYNYERNNVQNGEDISQAQPKRPNVYLEKGHSRYCGIFRGLLV
jgi:hypothetical protein